jgi:hypothetical protein
VFAQTTTTNLHGFWKRPTSEHAKTDHTWTEWRRQKGISFFSALLGTCDNGEPFGGDAREDRFLQFPEKARR